MNKNVKAHLAVFGTNLFFAANFSLVKLISPSLVRPFGLNVFRVGVSLILFWLVWMMGKSGGGIRREDWFRFFLCALTGVAINQMLFVKGLTMTSTVHASLLMLTTPLLITVFALWVLNEPMTKLKAAGLFLGVCGAVLVVAGREHTVPGPDYLTGDLLVFINAVSYSLYFVLVKPLMTRYSPLHVIRWIFTIGFFLIIPFGWKEAATTDFAIFALTDWAAFFAVVITGTFLAYYFNAYGISKLGAGITGAYIYMQPILAVIIATILLNESLTLQKIIAACLIFSGVYLVSRKS